MTSKDHALAEQHLAQAQRHVVEGSERIAKQEALIAQLDSDGHDTIEAKKVLATLRETQALHIDGRDRILKEMEQ